MKNIPVISWTLLTLQLAGIAAIAATGPLLARHTPGRVLELAGVLLGIWAIVTMRIRRVNPLPEPRAGNPMVTAGPYRVVRHPMYAAVLLAAGALVLDAPTPTRATLFAGLAGVLIVKLLYEESLLRSHFPGYADYCRRTWRLLPGLF